eukprot:scaffold233422_cov45-Prasinocladus_malaysianus.AAC.2
MYLIRYGSTEDRLGFTFQLFDTDDSGAIEKADLVEMLRVCLSENHMRLDEEQLARMASGMIWSLDEDKDGTLSLEDFLGIEKKYPGMVLLQMDGLQPQGKHSPESSCSGTPQRHIPAMNSPLASPLNSRGIIPTFTSPSHLSDSSNNRPSGHKVSNPVQFEINI